MGRRGVKQRFGLWEHECGVGSGSDTRDGKRQQLGVVGDEEIDASCRGGREVKRVQWLDAIECPELRVNLGGDECVG